MGAKIIREANQRHPTVFFQVGNAWRTAELLRIQQDFLYSAHLLLGVATSANATSIRVTDTLRKEEHDNRRIGFDVVYIDVGGLSGSDGLLEAISLVSSIRYALEPRCIVIKSLCMRRLSTALEPYWQIQKAATKE